MLLLLACAPGQVVLLDGDTGAPSVEGASCGAAPRGIAWFEQDAGALELTITAGVSRVGPGEDMPEVTARLRNAGPGELRGSWGGCGYPTWRLTDSRGNVAWEYSNDWDVSCTTSAFDWATGDGLDDAARLPELEDGRWQLSATAFAEFGDGENTAHTVTTELVVGADGCASHEVSADWPSGLRVSVDPGVAPYAADQTGEILASGLAIVDQRKVYADCRYPSFDVYAAETWESAWHYSAADGLACDPVEGWAVRDIRSDTAVLPAGVLPPGDFAFTAAFHTTDGVAFRVGSLLPVE